MAKFTLVFYLIGWKKCSIGHFFRNYRAKEIKQMHSWINLNTQWRIPPYRHERWNICELLCLLRFIFIRIVKNIQKLIKANILNSLMSLAFHKLSYMIELIVLPCGDYSSSFFLSLPKQKENQWCFLMNFRVQLWWLGVGNVLYPSKHFRQFYQQGLLQ